MITSCMQNFIENFCGITIFVVLYQITINKIECWEIFEKCLNFV